MSHNKTGNKHVLMRWRQSFFYHATRVLVTLCNRLLSLNNNSAKREGIVPFKDKRSSCWNRNQHVDVFIVRGFSLSETGERRTVLRYAFDSGMRTSD